MQLTERMMVALGWFGTVTCLNAECQSTDPVKIQMDRSVS